MKKIYRFNKIFLVLLITLVFLIISLMNIKMFNNSYMEEEKEELQVFKRQVEWVITPFLEKKDFTMVQKYCDDFRGEDISFRIFDRNKSLLASSGNQDNTKTISLTETIETPDDKYYLEIITSQADVMSSIIAAQKNVLFFCFVCLLLLAIYKMMLRLKRQKARLTSLEQYKTNFLQNITHEIKTPITAINSAIELLQTRSSISDNDRECFDIIQFQIKSINKLVNDILYLSEIEVEKTSDKKGFKIINLNSMIEGVISFINFPDIKINFIQNANIETKANEELLSTALSNLLLNAIKYSASKTIDVILNKNENIEITVKDYGTGIEKEHLDHLFERFYRVDKNRSRKLGGTGLGLAIVKNVAELHNGSVLVESEVNKGSSFTIKLPCDL